MTKDITPFKPPAKVWGLRIIAGLGAVAGIYAIYTIVWMAVSAAVGTGILIALGLAGIALFQSLPMLAQKFENRLLLARKREAEGNPIEQLENEWMRRSEMVNVFRQALVEISSQVEDMREELNNKKALDKKSGRTTNLEKEESAIAKMQLFLDNRKRKLEAAGVALADFKTAIDNATFSWNFQLKANKAIAAMNASDKNSKMEELLSEVAFSSVRSKFNKVFAELDMDASEINSHKSLKFDGQTIDVSKINIPQLEHVGVER